MHFGTLIIVLVIIQVFKLFLTSPVFHLLLLGAADTRIDREDNGRGSNAEYKCWLLLFTLFALHKSEWSQAVVEFEAEIDRAKSVNTNPRYEGLLDWRNITAIGSTKRGLSGYLDALGVVMTTFSSLGLQKDKRICREIKDLASKVVSQRKEAHEKYRGQDQRADDRHKSVLEVWEYLANNLA